MNAFSPGFIVVTGKSKYCTTSFITFLSSFIYLKSMAGAFRIDMFPTFPCGSADLNNEKSKVVVKYLMEEIKLCQEVTPLNKANQ